jgi:hypothetical protein
MEVLSPTPPLNAYIIENNIGIKIKIFLNFDLCLVWFSSTFLPTLKSHRLHSFSTINFELPLDPFNIQLLLAINDVFVGSMILNYLEK